MLTQKERNKNYYDQRKRDGLCQYCPNPRDGEKIRCKVCTEIVADYTAGRRDIWKLKGLCNVCGKNPASKGGYVSCADCRTRRYADDEKRKIEFNAV